MFNKKIIFWYDSFDPVNCNLEHNINPSSCHTWINWPWLRGKAWLKSIHTQELDPADCNLFIIEDPHLEQLVKPTSATFHRSVAWLKDHPNVNILIWLASEALDDFWPIHLKQQVLPLLQYFRGIENNIFYISGNLHCINLFEKFKLHHHKIYPELDQFKGVYPIDYFAWKLINDISTKEEKLYRKWKYQIKKEFRYNFINLNNVNRPHRLALLYQLANRDLIRKNLISYCNYAPGHTFVVKNNERYYAWKIAELLGLPDFDVISFCNELNLPWLVDGDKAVSERARLVPFDLYANAYFSLISETHCNELFITEKTYKPIALGHPFLVWGGAGTLAYLKQKGYKFYSAAFDESYDDQEDPKLRLRQIVNNIQRFEKLPLFTKKILAATMNRNATHNKTKFWQKSIYDYRRDVNKIFQDIINKS